MEMDIEDHLVAEMKSRGPQQRPYNLVYEIHDDLLLIVAVAHQRRHPDYWGGRFDRRVP